MKTIRLIHPVPVTLELAGKQKPTQIHLAAQVTWKRHGENALYQHANQEQFDGALTFQAHTVDKLQQAGKLIGAHIVHIAGTDYTKADLVIQHVVPMAHQAGVHSLIKAFFVANVFQELSIGIAQ